MFLPCSGALKTATSKFTDPLSHRLNEGLEGKFYKFFTFHLKSTIFWGWTGADCLRSLTPETRNHVCLVPYADQS